MGRTKADTWRVAATSGSATLHATLFLRDAYQLKPDDEPAIPPHLRGDVPELSALTATFDEREAAQAWTPWWERALSAEVDAVTGSATWPPDAVRATFFDPPEFASVATSPALRALARTSHREALRWSKYHPALTRDALRRALRDSVVSPVAWATCAALHVSPAQLRASIVVLEVEGLWTSLARPGVLVCSVGVVRKESALQESLREAFVRTVEAAR